MRPRAFDATTSQPLRRVARIVRRATLALLSASYIGAVMIAAASPGSARGETVTPQETPLTAYTLQQRAQKLRAEINATYKQLRKSKSLKISLEGGNDVSPIVLKYIPI